MPGAIIVADQLSGAGAGSPGVARNDLWLGQAVSLYIGTGGNTSYLWELLAKPPGSAVSLSTPTASTSGFTPDEVGTYRVRLTTNGGGVGNTQTLVLRARYDNTGVLSQRGWAYPSLGELSPEANYGGNDRGWAEVFESILEDIRAQVEERVRLSAAALTTSTTLTKNRVHDYDPSGGTFTLTVPASPVRGDFFEIVNGTSDTTAITVDGDGDLIVDPGTMTAQANFSYNTAFGSLRYVYDGSQWLLLSST